MNQSKFDELFDLINAGKKGKNIGLSTGLPKLDKIIGGIQSSRYLLVSAGSSVGKTSFILYIIYQILKQIKPEKPVYFCYWSLEIGSDVLLAKLLALYCAEEFGIYLTINDVFSFEKPLDDYHYQCLLKGREWLNKVSPYIHIIDRALNARVFYSEMMKYLEEHFEKSEDGFVKPKNPQQQIIGVIDHLNLIRAEAGHTQKEEIDITSSYMVTLKRKFKVS